MNTWDPGQIRAAFEAAQANVKRSKSHAYSILVGDPGTWERVPGVTSILGVIDKSRPLMVWATRLERQACIEAARKAYREGLPSGLTDEQFNALFNQQIDAQMAYVKAKEEAANIGTDLHALVEHRCRMMLGEETPEPPAKDESVFLFEAWQEWAVLNDFEPLLVEMPCYSTTMRYAGTGDVLGYVRGNLFLIDWKTSNGLYPEYDVQNAAYRAALVEMGVIPELTRGLLVRLPKQAGDPQPFEEHEIDPMNDDTLMDVFRACRAIYPWKQDEDRKGLERWKAKKNRQDSAA